MKVHDRITIPVRWEVGCSAQAETSPAEFVPAQVPGAVQLDFARALHYPDYGSGENFRRFEWMEDRHYLYRAFFPHPGLEPGQRLWFVSKGIDYAFRISLNGRGLYARAGMFAPVEIDLTECLMEENRLEIAISPVPKLHPAPADRSQAAGAVKPPVSYGWDWHPRLIPLGIWDDTVLEVRHAASIRDVHVGYVLSEDLQQAELTLRAQTSAVEGLRYRWTLRDPDGAGVLYREGELEREVEIGAVLESPRLWWTHDHGAPELYESEFVIRSAAGEVLDRAVSHIGFRRIRLVMNEGAWDEPRDFPKGPSVDPIQLELNGRRVFAKGTNWVNPEIFPGTITEKRYDELLDLALEANFNLLRVWGGGIVNKDSFYDLCDRKGLMVWQEFPLACNDYPDDDRYLAVLEREAEAIIRRLRKHPCLAIWCGGNELFNNWSGMTRQSWALRLLDALCYRHDRHTPFLPTSPIYGMGHGNYVFKWEGREVLETMLESRNTAYTEFGMPGISPRSVLERALPAEELFPPREHSSWQSHHAYHAWDALPDTWLCMGLLEEYFGAADTLDQLIERSQTLQCVGYKTIYEEARRQKPYCSMALNWCFNDVWPVAANNSLIAYPAEPKPAFRAVAASCRPVCTSARFRKFVWTAGEMFEAELWVLNDRFAEAPGLKVKVWLETPAESTFLLEWNSPQLKPNANVAGPTVRFALSEDAPPRFVLRLEAEHFPEYDSEYLFLARPKETESPRTAVMNV